MERKVFCLNKISTVGLKTFTNDYSLTEDLNEATAVMVRSAAMHEMKLPESVLCVARAGAGVNNIPLANYASEGVVVFNTPGANANAVKELVIASMLLAARDISGGINWVKDNRNDDNINKTVEKAKSAFAGTEILGKTLGIIGLGAVGALVAQVAGYLGMHVVAVEPSEATIKRNGYLLPKDIKIVHSNDELFALSDYISIHVPLLDSTRGMINKEAFDKMKDGVIIINIARDAIVNDDDLKEALSSKKVRRYVTDFPNYKTANMDEVIAIPHLGASTEEAEDNCASMAASEIMEYLEEGNIINSVNYPRIDLGKKVHKRMVVLHKAIEGLPDHIVDAVRNANKEIFKMQTGIKGEYGATVIEFENSNNLDHLCPRETISSLEGVIKVLVIK